MEKKAAAICGTVGLLGLATVVLGFVGEFTKPQSFVRYDGVSCVYRSTPALGCGVVAAVFLLAAQVVVSAATGCCGCCRTQKIPSRTKRVVAVAMSVVSWFLLCVAEVLFFGGAAWNTAREWAPARPANGSSQTGECYVLQGGVFATASFLSIVIVALGITSYFLLGASAPPQQLEIAMGHHLPPYFQPEGGYTAGAAWPHDGKASTSVI